MQRVYLSKSKVKCKFCPSEVRKDRLSDHVNSFHKEKNQKSTGNVNAFEAFFKKTPARRRVLDSDRNLQMVNFTR